MKIEDNSPGIAEIILIGIVKPIRKVSVEVIDFCWSNCHHVPDRDVYPPAECHRKRVVRRGCREATHPRANHTNILECICIDIGMGPPNKA